MEQVYIFDFGDRIKAGYSTNVEKRLRTIELSSGMPAKQSYAVNAGREVEKLLHSKLSNRLLGEFFAFPFDRAKEILDEIMVNYKPLKLISDNTKVRQMVEMACAYASMTKADLARELGWSPQTLSNRISTGKFSVDDWDAIGKALGATAQITFTFPDGKIIE